MARSARDDVISNTVIRSLALREMVAALLALQARASADPEALFRQISTHLDGRLEKIGATENLLPHIEGARRELDLVITEARTLLALFD